MTQRRPDPRTNHASSLVVVVLVASTVVAAVLAGQAISAARQRRAISEAMLGQYAQLAALEFARQARRDLEHALTQTLNTYAHPERAGAPHPGERPCACLPPAAIEHWFEVSASGDVKLEPEALRSTVTSLLARGQRASPDGTSEGMVTIVKIPGDDARFVAVKDEPHLQPRSGQIGLIASVAALASAVERAYETSTLLPARLAGGRDARGMVHLRVQDGSGIALFSSPGTVEGPVVVNVPLWEDVLPLKAAVSMTPAFVAGLGPEHGVNSSMTVIAALVANMLLVGVGLWQLKRERDLTQLRGDFVAGVSHEMRTPLAQIRMFSETLLLDRVRSPEERQRALRIIGQESARLSHLVDNVLQFHRRGGVAAAAPGQMMDLNIFVADVIQSFEPLAASSQTRLVFEPVNDPAPVRADVGALRQVLLNLLDNAVKFGPAGQTVSVSIRRVGTDVALSIADEGTGVPVGDRSRIFDAFERGRETHGTGGAGIGLAVVRDIVLEHHGRVTVEESPAGGAQFTVTLPVASEAV